MYGVYPSNYFISNFLHISVKVQKFLTLSLSELQEASSTFITLETLDEAIDHAIANPVDYNYAIDMRGRQFIGRDTPIAAHKSDKAQSSQ